MQEDATLLRRFVEDHAEEAFTHLVQRHFNLVHGTALRRVGGDAHLAQDVAQAVFIALARKASSLRGHASLAGWLYVSTHRATAEIVRGEQRRKHREAAAQAMQLTDGTDQPPLDPAALRPLLDDALIDLPADDREAVVLRYFAQRSFAEIGAALRITEEAARKRVDRALEKMQARLSRRGITSTVAALGGVLGAGGAAAAPATLVTQVAAVALAESALVPAALSFAPLLSSLLPAAAVAVVITGLGTIIPQQRANAAMAEEIAGLERAHDQTTARVTSEIADLQLALKLAQTPPPPPARAAIASLPSPTKRPAAAATTVPEVQLTVSPRGELNWQGDSVTLDEFLILLARYQTDAATSGSRLVIKGNGSRYPQLNWVLEEISKVKITNLVIESDSEPKAAMATAWF